MGKSIETYCFISVAEFSISGQTTFQVDEPIGAATVCVELTSSVLLDRDIALELLPAADSTASSSDFDGSTLMYMFPTGSSTGDFICNPIGITEDGVVEGTEEFSIQLMHNPQVDDVSIAQQGSVSISITDSDSELPTCVPNLLLIYTIFIQVLLFFSLR